MQERIPRLLRLILLLLCLLLHIFFLTPLLLLLLLLLLRFLSTPRPPVWHNLSTYDYIKLMRERRAAGLAPTLCVLGCCQGRQNRVNPASPDDATSPPALPEPAPPAAARQAFVADDAQDSDDRSHGSGSEPEWRRDTKL